MLLEDVICWLICEDIPPTIVVNLLSNSPLSILEDACDYLIYVITVKFPAGYTDN